MITFYAKRTRVGRTLALIRVRDDEAEIWTPDGWKPFGLEWSGIGGATEYDSVTVEEAVVILDEFGAADINPTASVGTR